MNYTLTQLGRKTPLVSVMNKGKNTGVHELYRGHIEAFLKESHTMLISLRYM